jgi:hypothetical protein
MNIAFPALFIFLFILPGILLRYSYRKGFWHSPVQIHSLQEEFAQSILFAIIIQLFCIFITQHLLNFDICFDSILVLLTGWPNISSESISKYIHSTIALPHASLGYMFVTNLGAYLTGLMMHSIVRYFRLDLRYDWLRFDNKWFYMFSGESNIFNIAQSDRTFVIIRELLSENVGLVYITCLVNLNNCSYLYLGIISDYFFDKSGNLDENILSVAKRRKLDGKKYFEINGDNLILKYENVVNLNIECLKLVE